MAERAQLDLDVSFYLDAYPDLRVLSREAAAQHYRDYGEREGRQAGPLARREGLVQSIGASDEVLEIGPFFNPLVTGPRVKYLDVMDRDALVARAVRYGWPTERIPEIDFVSPSGSLSLVPSESADVVVSAHCVEHQTDLLGHLLHAQRILRKGGRYLLIVPDKRYMFDHFLPETTLADVVAAHHERRERHTLTLVIECRALSTHNETHRHWSGDHGAPGYIYDPSLVQNAIREFESAQGAYIDVHAWKFTPLGFQTLMKDLFDAGMMDLDVKLCHGTVGGDMEFCCVLEKGCAR